MNDAAAPVKCKHTIYGARVSSWACGKSAGHGPGGSYCSTHARLHEKVDAELTIWELEIRFGDGIPKPLKVRSFGEKTFIDADGRRRSTQNEYSLFFATQREATIEAISISERRLKQANAAAAKHAASLVKLKALL